VGKANASMAGTGEIIGLTQWLQTPAGRYLLDWEQRHLEVALADVFGFHAVQLGLPELDGLRGNRMPHRSTWWCCRTRSRSHATRTSRCARSTAC
jgi:hypothetical protein